MWASLIENERHQKQTVVLRPSFAQFTRLTCYRPSFRYSTITFRLLIICFPFLPSSLADLPPHSPSVAAFLLISISVCVLQACCTKVFGKCIFDLSNFFNLLPRCLRTLSFSLSLFLSLPVFPSLSVSVLVSVSVYPSLSTFLCLCSLFIYSAVSLFLCFFIAVIMSRLICRRIIVHVIHLHTVLLAPH